MDRKTITANQAHCLRPAPQKNTSRHVSAGRGTKKAKLGLGPVSERAWIFKLALCVEWQAERKDNIALVERHSLQQSHWVYMRAKGCAAHAKRGNCATHEAYLPASSTTTGYAANVLQLAYNHFRLVPPVFVILIDLSARDEGSDAASPAELHHAAL